MPLLLTLLSLASAATGLLVPGPSGPYAVGYSTLVLTDDSRQDPFAPTPQKRRVPVSAYLPVDISSRGSKPCPPRTLPYMTPAVAAYYDQGAAQIGLPNDTFAKYAVTYCDLEKLCAKKPRASFPLVLFDTGVGPPRSLYGVKARNLASQGYIVVTVDHPYDAEVVEFPDGSVVKATAFNGTEAEIEHFLKVRGQDLVFVLSQLQHSRAVRRSLLAHYPSAVDFTRVASVGHSLGGVASELVANMPGSLVRGAVNMDGGIREPVLSFGADKPTMQFGRAGHGDTDPSWDAFWARLRGPAVELALANATHGTFTDALTLAAPFLAGLPPPVAEALRGELGHIAPADAEASIGGALLAALEFVFEGRKEGIDKIHEHYESLAIVRSHL
ncbi:PAF acetylhydrolase family protein [Cordyceps militaris CM01]|uniref:1-alkyl-2-acetylglycerophosphocholine esterase n=1 Tax=Cordyceps militaris (strain CM01) TaxID=983644 RepID=G3JIL7_CORMM|nr:PAF acetylhydrolase family protein [Cordyceps militaris CM01]EGX91914.1 PAF acetylhydrolase family protein [Cordyceps militaris CM01]